MQKHSSSSSPVAQKVKNLPAVRETWVQSLGREDPLEKEMATHSNPLQLQCSCLENSMDRGAWQATVPGVTESDTTEHSTPSLKEAQICLLLREKLPFPFLNYNDLLDRAGSKQSNHIHIPEGFSLIFLLSIYLQQL